MNFIENTYRTLSGIKKIIELPQKKYHQWIVYQNNEPAYFVDFYDLEKESNVMMNSLVMCTKRSIQEVLEAISKKNNVQLSIPKVSRIGIQKKVKSQDIKLNLQPLPKKWLSYSL